MSKQIDEPLLDVGQTLTKWEQKLEENKKSYGIVAGAIILAVAGYFAYTKLYVAPQESEAQAAMFQAERYFAADSVDKAMFGDGTNLGFNDIIDDYGVTKTANLAHYYMGLSHLKKGEFQNAIDQLGDFDADDQILGAVALGAMGDAYMELGNTKEATSYYMKAAKKNENKFTSPIYLMRAGLGYEESGKYKDAVKVYEEIKEEYPESSEGREVEKYLARATALSKR